MTLSLDNNTAQFKIRAYKPGYIQINETLYTHSVIVGPETLITDWPPQIIDALLYEHLTIISQLRPSILLIGTGKTLKFPSIETYGELINQGIGVEIMDTHAACRTYNALTAENRNVIAALMVN